jgi:dTDP-glucose 4,6-dehydratase
MRLNDGRGLPNFMRQGLKGEAITVYGDGKQTRSFQYVDDLVEGIWRLLKSDEVFPVNIGNPMEITILQLAEEIRELTGGHSEITFQDLPEGFEDDPKIRQPHVERARKILDWEPRVSRREGLERTLQDFRERILSQDNSVESIHG